MGATALPMLEKAARAYENQQIKFEEAQAWVEYQLSHPDPSWPPVRRSSLLPVTVRGSTKTQADEKQCSYHFPSPHLHMQPSVPSLSNVTSRGVRPCTRRTHSSPSFSSDPLQTNLRHQLGFKELQAAGSWAGSADKANTMALSVNRGSSSSRASFGEKCLPVAKLLTSQLLSSTGRTMESNF